MDLSENGFIKYLHTSLNMQRVKSSKIKAFTTSAVSLWALLNRLIPRQLWDEVFKRAWRCVSEKYKQISNANTANMNFPLRKVRLFFQCVSKLKIVLTPNKRRGIKSE